MCFFCLFQYPENQINYELAVGNIGADYFRIDPNSGLISVSQRASLDPAQPSQYVVNMNHSVTVYISVKKMSLF